MLWWYVQMDPQRWDLMVLLLLFAACKAPWSLLGRALFDLVYRH